MVPSQTAPQTSNMTEIHMIYGKLNIPVPGVSGYRDSGRRSRGAQHQSFRVKGSGRVRAVFR